MARLEGFRCDNCKKEGKEGLFGNLPYSWYSVLPGSDPYRQVSFCSRECLTAWVNGTAAVPFYERPRVLFVKWLKALFQ